MDYTDRKITKIAREVNKMLSFSLKADGIGAGEMDFIHTVRHNEGITQAQVRKMLNLDKGAAARRTASLETKGYIVRREDELDKRKFHIFSTPKAEKLKLSKVACEKIFYEWLLNDLNENERKDFCATLDKLYIKSKRESRAGFPDVSVLLKGGEENEK